MKFNVKEIKVFNLEGREMFVELNKTIGNVIYEQTSTIEWEEKAKEIHKGNEVDMDEVELGRLIMVIAAPHCMFVIAVKRAIINYCQALIKEGRKEKEVLEAQAVDEVLEVTENIKN